MDFGKSNYGTVDAIEKSVVVHLHSPFDTSVLLYEPLYGEDGEPLVVDGINQVDKDKPITFGVKYARCVAGKVVGKRYDRMSARGVQINPERLAIDILAAITTGWTCIGDEKGPIKCTPESVTAFLTEYIDFVPQISGVASDLSNYGEDANLFTK